MKNEMNTLLPNMLLTHNGIKHMLLTGPLILPCLVLHRASMMIVAVVHAGMVGQVVGYTVHWEETCLVDAHFKFHSGS